MTCRDASIHTGPSGSGKTTLLLCVSGAAAPTSGSVEVNGAPFDANTMRRVASFVPQDDLLTPCLTVEESLREAVLFKTGHAADSLECDQKVNELAERFGLVDCLTTPVGRPGEGKRGASGGQRRRLSVALELCGDPSLLFLDEPTSGLDAVATMSLVRSLQALAKRGVCCVAVIHQPSAAAFFAFDRLLLLRAGGSLVYEGPIQPGAQPAKMLADVGRPVHELANPADAMFDALTEEPDALTKAAPQAPPLPPPPPPISTSGPRYALSLPGQVRAHCVRNARAMVREPILARMRIGSAVGVSIVLSILYGELDSNFEGINSTISLLLFTMVFLALTSALPVVLSVLPEIHVTQKEVRNNWYRPTSYTPAKFIVETPLLIIPPLLYLAIVGNVTGLTRGNNGARFIRVYLACLATVVCTNSWSFLLSSVAPTMQLAVLSAPGSIMPMMLLSGFFVNQRDMTWVFRWATYIDYLNYVWQALAIAGLQDRTYNAPPGAGLDTGEQVLKTRLKLPDYTGSWKKNYWVNIGILAGFILVFRAAAVIVVARRLSR